MTKRILLIVLIVAGILGLGVGFLIGPTAKRLLDSGSSGGTALWASSATTVVEQAQEADLIVRVRAESVDEPEVLTFGDEPQTEEIAQIEGHVTVIPFTDTHMRVLKVYKGSVLVGETITVRQTGGSLPGTKDSPARNVALEGNPIFTTGGEHILFLKDISGDRIHAPNRELYRLINPASRYDIQGEAVISHADFVGKRLPTRLEALLDEIKQTTAIK